MLLNLIKFMQFGVENILGIIIIHTIWFLLLIGLGVVIYHWRRIYHFEMANMEEARNNFKNNPGISRENPANPTAETSLGIPLEALEKWKTDLTQGVQEKSSVYRRIENLYEIRRQGSEVNQDTLSDILAGEQSTKASAAKYIFGILIVLGLIGTLVGLTTAVHEVQPLVTNIESLEDLTQMSRIIRKTLSGMSTAFGTTLAGLIATIILGFVYHCFTKRQTLFLADLEEFTTTSLMPQLSFTESDAIQNVAQSFETTAATMDLTARILADTSEQLDAKLELVYNFTEHFEQSTSGMLNGLKVIREVQQEISNIVEKFHSGVAEIMQNQSESTKILNATLSSVQAGNENFSKSFQEHQATQKSFLNTLTTKLDAEKSTFRDELSRVLRQNESHMKDIFNRQRMMIERLEIFLKEQEYQKHIEKQTKALGTILSDIRSSIDNQQQTLNDALEKLASRLEQPTDEQEDEKQYALLNDISLNLRDLNATFKAEFAEMPNRIKKVASRLEQPPPDEQDDGKQYDLLNDISLNLRDLNATLKAQFAKKPSRIKAAIRRMFANMQSIRISKPFTKFSKKGEPIADDIKDDIEVMK